MRITPSDILPPWQHLTRTQRIAGTPADLRTSKYLLSQLQSFPLADPHIEPFPCNSLHNSKASLEIRDSRSWKRIPCEILVGSPSTRSPHRPTEMDLVWVEMPEQAHLLKPGSLRNKALGIFGPLATNTDHHRAIVRTQASVVIWVDDRFPFTWPKADGILPAWAKLHGVLPTVGVPFRAAYDWRCKGLSRVRVAVFTNHVASTSYNIVADLPGSDPTLPCIAFGCHHDTQVGNVGADDNASGVVAVLALAKVFARVSRNKPLARTLRFIAFGAEEQLSVGSRAYCLDHRRQMKSHGLMINFDSIASALGHTEMLVAGSTAMEKWFQTRLLKNNLPLRVTREVNPFSDHFPFTALGVPAVWFFRPNCPGGRWQHHAKLDTLRNCSPEVVCAILNSLIPLITTLANTRTLPFPSTFGPDQLPTIQKYARELYDMRP